MRMLSGSVLEKEIPNGKSFLSKLGYIIAWESTQHLLHLPMKDNQKPNSLKPLRPS